MLSLPKNAYNPLTSLVNSPIEPVKMQNSSLQSDGNATTDPRILHHHRSAFSLNRNFLVLCATLALLIGSVLVVGQKLQQNNLTIAGHAPITMPAITNHLSNSGVYGAMENYLYKLDKTGKRVWEHDIKGLGSKIAVSNGIVYAYTIRNEVNYISHVYAFRAEDGKLLWNVKVLAGVQAGSNLVVDNQNIYVFSDQGTIYAFSVNNGKQHWIYPTHAVYINNSGKMSVANNILYISNGHHFYALHTTNGHLFWMKNSPVSNEMFSMPLVINGVVYITSSNEAQPGTSIPSVSTLYAWNTNGNLRWRSPQIKDFVLAAPSIGSNQLYITGINRVYALNIANGKISWQKFVGTTSLDSPLFDHGALYLALEGPYQWTFNQGHSKTHATSVIKLNAYNGSLIWQTHYTTMVPTVQTVVNGVLYVNTYDVYALRTSNHTNLWSYTLSIPNPTRPQGIGNAIIVIP